VNSASRSFRRGRPARSPCAVGRHRRRSRRRRQASNGS
jgi:hypothetical protein